MFDADDKLLFKWSYLNINPRMNNGLLIALAIIFTIILLAINLYLLALYVHTDDKGFGTALYCKILVVVGLTLCQAQALLVPLDVANVSALDSGGIDMKGFWYFIYLLVLCFICLLMPYALFFYQTNEEEGICRRLVRAFFYTLAANIISILVIFISWAYLKFVMLPVHTIQANGNTSFTDGFTVGSIVQVQGDITLQLQASFAVYIVALMSWFGWILLVLFGGVGLFSLPIDMINQFRHRPIARKTEDMKRTRDNLATAISSMTKQGQELKKMDEESGKDEETGWFDRWRGKREVGNKLTEFKAKFSALSDEIQIFNLQLKYADTNPIIPVLKLILGVIFLITTLLWVLQIIFGNLAKSFGNRPLIPFLNEFLMKLDSGNAGFIATFIFAYFCLYMLWCMQKGAVKFGIRLPCCCRFHPMKENETWMNSFLFNVILMLIASVGVIQLCISSFPTYTRNTEIYAIVGIQVEYMKFYNAFYHNGVFPIALIIWTFLTLIYLLCTCNKKPAYMKEIERIRNHDDE